MFLNELLAFAAEILLFASFVTWITAMAKKKKK